METGRGRIDDFAAGRQTPAQPAVSPRAPRCRGEDSGSRSRAANRASYSKQEILALYLNLAAYGNQIVGAERASRAYFGCAASMLTPAQAAFLAGLPQRPSGFNPYRSFDAASTRQRVVLGRMQRIGVLSSDQLREALAEQLTLHHSSSPFSAPHFVEMVLDAVPNTRLQTVRTTLDAALQADVHGI